MWLWLVKICGIWSPEIDMIDFPNHNIGKLLFIIINASMDTNRTPIKNNLLDWIKCWSHHLTDSYRLCSLWLNVEYFYNNIYLFDQFWWYCNLIKNWYCSATNFYSHNVDCYNFIPKNIQCYEDSNHNLKTEISKGNNETLRFLYNLFCIPRKGDNFSIATKKS